MWNVNAKPFEHFPNVNPIRIQYPHSHLYTGIIMV